MNMFSNSLYSNRMVKIVKFVIKKLVNFNVFLDAKTLEEQNAKTIRDQLLATRLYLLLFLAIVITFVLINSLTTKIISLTISEPSLDTYDRLYATYPNTLSCSCKAVTITYSTFMSMEYVRHPVRFFM